MTDQQTLPKWIKFAKKALSGNGLFLRETASAKKIISLYEPRAHYESFDLRELVDRDNSKRILRLKEIFTMMNLMKKPEISNWGSYKIVSFFADMLPLSVILNQYEPTMLDIDVRLPLNTEDEARLLDSALSDLSDLEKDRIVKQLNHDLYSDNGIYSHILDVSKFKCLGFFIYDNNKEGCDNSFCLTHRADQEEIISVIVGTRFFEEILCKTEYSNQDLRDQGRQLLSESQSQIVCDSQKWKYSMLKKFAELMPEQAHEFLVFYFLTDKMRVHDFIRLILPSLLRDPNLSKELIQMCEQDKYGYKLMDFTLSENRRYLINHCGWDAGLPAEYFDKALHTDLLVDIYSKAVEDREFLNATIDSYSANRSY